MTFIRHWIIIAIMPAISACAGMADRQEDGFLVEEAGVVKTCDKVAVTGSLIKKRVVCEERVDYESIAAYEQWRREYQRARLYGEAIKSLSGNQ